MKTKTKKLTTREGAILIASAAACTPDVGDHGRRSYAVIREDLQQGGDEEVSFASYSLATQAWGYVFELWDAGWTQDVDAEVEALLRWGWEPGDEVHLIAPTPEAMPHHVGATDSAGTESDPQLIQDLDDAAEHIVASPGYPACAGNDPDEEPLQTTDDEDAP